MLSIQEVSKHFDGITAIKDVSFSIEQGEIVGLVGPNGAGKSTLLNVISGIYLPSSGSIIFDGLDITDMNPDKVCKHGIAKTFQLVQSFPELTAIQNVLVGAVFGNSDKISMAEAREKAERNLEFIGYPMNKMNYPVKNLTVVELKRIQLARALATEPKLLLLDEVTTGLNPKESNDAISLIQKIRESGITILIVEHVMRVIMNVSDSIVVLHHGEKIAEGTPHEIANDEKVITSYLGKRYMPDIMLELKDLKVAYEKVQVLWDISLSIKTGEAVTLLGSNGAGKSTTVKTIQGILKPNSGSIKFMDKHIEGLPAYKIVDEGIALVPEGREIFPKMSVFENLILGAYVPRAKEFMDESLEWVLKLFPKLEERKKQLAGTMSGGEQQMLAIARALMSKPKLLMLDEPSLGLAPMVVLQVFEIIEKLHEEGVTLLLVEQNVHHALEISDSAYVLEKGKIILEGKGLELLDDEYVKSAYLGV